MDFPFKITLPAERKIYSVLLASQLTSLAMHLQGMTELHTIQRSDEVNATNFSLAEPPEDLLQYIRNLLDNGEQPCSSPYFELEEISEKPFLNRWTAQTAHLAVVIEMFLKGEIKLLNRVSYLRHIQVRSATRLRD